MKIRTEKRALDKIYKRRDRYDIPEWQREEVWGPNKKKKLIDSILRNWKLPKFYFLKISDKPVEYEVVDGQQRLAAIYEFLDNSLPLSVETAKRFGATYYKDLPDDVSDAFDDFEIDFDEIEDASDVEIKEFFQRLQEGLPLTSSEKLNAVESKLRDFCKRLAKHSFFKETVSLSDKRYAYFDIAAKAAAIEIEGLDVGHRYDDLKEVFEGQAAFSSNSLVAKRLRDALTFLHKALPPNSTMLKNRSVVQSLITLACRLLEDGAVEGKEKIFEKFVTSFASELSKQVELGHEATDPDYVMFQRTVNANVKSGPKIRNYVLLRKLLQFEPAFTEIIDPASVAASGIDKEIGRIGGEIAILVKNVNEVYAATHGSDLIKPTNKTTSSLLSIREPVGDYDGYKNFIGNLYFLFWEGPGTKLAGNEPQSYKDVNDLRTALQHDLDHGKESKSKAKKKKLGATFMKYSGVAAPNVVAPERFPVIQLKLLSSIETDLRVLLQQFS